jgi:outer membrane protein assembly factor BamB
VTAGRYDDARTGANLRESVLTPEAIRRKGLGRLFTYNVEGFIYAQPLVATGVTTASGPRNMLIVATTTNKLYALDADTNMPGGGVIWQADLTVPGGTLTEEPASPLYHLAPSVGILSTPVIDRKTDTLYVVSRSRVAGAGGSGQYVQQLHARRLDTGAQKAVVTIQAQVNGKTFNPAIQTNRPGLVLAQGLIVSSWGPFLDEQTSHGWVMAHDAATLQAKGVFCTSCSGVWWGGTIWQSGRPPAVDAAGRFLYMFTANGSWRGQVPDFMQSCQPASDQKPAGYFAESLLKLDLEHPDLWQSNQAVASWTPYDWCELEQDDADLGGSGPMLIPGVAQPAPSWGGVGPQSGPTTIAIGGGKAGVLYAIDTAKITSPNLIEWMPLPAPAQHLRLSAINECINFDTYEKTIEPPDGTGVSIPGLFTSPPVALPTISHPGGPFGPPIIGGLRPLCAPLYLSPHTGSTYGAGSDGLSHHVMAGPVFWPTTWLVDSGLPVGQPGTGLLYIAPENLPLVSYEVREGHLKGIRAHAHQEETGCPRPAISGHPGGLLTLSANGDVPGSGIVWVSHHHRESFNDNALPVMKQGVLEAYDAGTLGLLWTSDRSTQVGPFAKFTPPTVANGKVYLPVSPSPSTATCPTGNCPAYSTAGSNGAIAVFGLSANATPQCVKFPGPVQRPFDPLRPDPGPLAVWLATTIAVTVAVTLTILAVMGRLRRSSR